jgi:RNA polymerase sigma factor (sigma-70 family)
VQSNSVTMWLRQLGDRNQQAVQELWDRYSETLKRLVRQRYPNALNALADESDIVQSVFHGLWNGAAEGRWDSVQDRQELWWLLVSICRHKALKCHAYNHRLKRRAESNDVRAGHHFGSIADVEECEDEVPPPELIVILQEEQDRLMGLLRDDELRSIALWKLEGFTHEEIADKLGVTPRTIVRKLNLVRQTWSYELDP